MWFFFLLGVISSAHSLNNGLARTPPMGWLTWERFRCTTNCEKYPNECISENLIKRTADLLVSDGYLQAGYNYIIIDDCWLARRRNRNGRLVADPVRFPSGIRALADYVHSKGLKIGIFENLGNSTCEGYPGIMGYERLDVQTLVDWDIDYLKLGGCRYNPDRLDEAYSAIGRLLNATGRQVFYACSWASYLERIGVRPNYAAISATCNSGRFWLDIDDSWSSLTSIINRLGNNQRMLAGYAGPGYWNDPDQLIIGNFGLSEDQARVQMAIWAVAASPLIMSTDLTTISQEFKKILLNRAIIAVNQDPLGRQGLRIWKNNGCETVKRGQLEIWKRDQCDGSYALAFVSQRDDGTPYAANFTSSEMKLPFNTIFTVTDLYNEDPKQTYGPGGNFEVRINPTGVKFYKFTPKKSSEIPIEVLQARRVVG